MSRKEQVSSQNIKHFYSNESAVLGLPLRLTVSIVIGILALSFILAFILNPCLFPKTMIVSIDPLMYELPVGHTSSTCNFTVVVTETDGTPINHAEVIIKGLGGIGSEYTQQNGSSTIQLTVELKNGQYEGYLEVLVKAPCYTSFSQDDMIKIVKGL
jgi:hypothetical protein